MRLGILSDVHGNLEALEVVLDFLVRNKATRFVCCGDIVGYGPDPHLCIERIRSLRALCVAGNHDRGVLSRVAAREFNTSARTALVWTRRQLTKDDLHYLDSLPLVDDFFGLHVVHSNCSAPEHWEYIFTVREAEEEMAYFSTPACALGHSHYAFIVERRPGEEARLSANHSVQMRPDAKYVINAGSVGQPRDGDPRASCVLLDAESGLVSIHRLAYDIPSVQAKMSRAGMPEFLISRLSLGR